MQREQLKSRLGFILLSAGCAIGIGNVWKFPYMVGKHGGAIFVLFYFLFLIALALPILTTEFAVGRAAKASPTLSFNKLEPEGSHWHLHGYLCWLANFMLMAFYVPVTGWMLHYCYLTATGQLAGLSADLIGKSFGALLGNIPVMCFWAFLVTMLGCFVCAKGLNDGLENITKKMMLVLLVLMIVLAGHSLTMAGAKEGLEFYLVPNLDNMLKVGVVNTLVGAMNQAFFTLSLGIGSMAIFGSYIGREHSLLGESLNIALLDTFVAIVAGLIIFPACFTYHVDQAAGPSLIFITLPNIFAHMPMGVLWGSIFFLFLSFAALSTVFAVFENIISCTMDACQWSRKKASSVCFFIIFIMTIPCILGFTVCSGGWLKIFGGTVLDVEDFFVSNLCLPIGALVYTLFCVTRYGWGWDNYIAECNAGEGAKIPASSRFYITYILPMLAIAVFCFGIFEKFFS